MPIFYEAFVKGLDRAGNQVAVFSHSFFGSDFGKIDAKTAIKQFEPDICIIFNT